MPPGAAFCPVVGGAFTVRFVTFNLFLHRLPPIALREILSALACNRTTMTSTRRAPDLVGVGTPPRFPPARLAAGPVRLRARHPL